MTVTIKANFTKTTEEDGYRTRVEVIDAEGVAMEVFVFNTADSTFSHVASVFDLETYTTSQSAAAALNQKFFRSRTLTRIDSSIVLATEFETVTRSRLQFLTVSWEAAQADYEGEELVTFTSDSN